jgi:triphosphatase
MDRMARELELKIELSKSDVDRLADEIHSVELSVGSPASRKLKTVYFDTLAHDLHAAGFSLRLRRQDGGWLQTVKADQRVAEGISNPIELEVAVDSDTPNIDRIADKKIQRKVRKAIGGAGLHPVFETIVHRTTRKIEVQHSEIELTVDDGEVRAGKSQRQLREAELELKAGSAEGLLLAAEKLLGSHDLKLSTRSKAERGYRLALGKKGLSPDPEKARPAAVRQKDTCGEALSAVLASATRQVLVNRSAVLETDDPDAAHQLRIGLRRLRSALRTLRPLVDRASLRAFERRARAMGRCVGVLRDADVLISGLYAPIEGAASDKTGFAELHDALVADRVAKRDEVRKALTGPAWTKLQLYLTLWPRTLDEIPNLDKPITKHARKVLHKAWKKPARLGRHLDRLDPEHRHEMRKALKRLRYQAEFMAPLFDKRDTRRFLARLKDLQDVFGYINDVRLARRLSEVPKARHAGVDAARAASYAIGRHEAEASHVWRQAGKAWKKLARSPHFWT